MSSALSAPIPTVYASSTAALDSAVLKGFFQRDSVLTGVPGGDTPYPSLNGDFYNGDAMNDRFPRCLFAAIVFLILLSLPAHSQTSTPSPDPHSIPSVDAGIGSCTADFIITDSDNKPIYAAQIKVHIAYGFGSFHKLDLQVGTNADGKARFTGLPNRLKRGGLFFQASEGDRTGDAFDDPSKTCQTQFTVVLRKPLTPTP